MSEEKIDSYVDRAGVKGDTEYIISAINEVYTAFKKVEGVKVDLKGFSGLSGISPVLASAKAGADSLAIATEVVTERISKMNGQSKEFTTVLLGQARAQKETAAAALLSAKATTEEAKARYYNAKAANEEAKATKESTKAKIDSEKMTDQLTDDYFQLGKAYNDAARKAKNFQIALGENHPIALQAVKDANDIGNMLKRLDASVGQHQRNVGNYKSAFDGLGFSFTQVARELPTLSQSFELFARAIGNNLPMVADEIGKAKKEIAALKAEGKDTPGLFSRIAKGIFSFQVLLSVGITLFTVYSKQFGNFISNLFKSSSAIDQLKRQQSELNDIQREVAKSTGNEIAQLQVLYKVATNTNVPIKERHKAVDELQKQYPDYFKNIKDEIILQGKAAEAYDKTKAAILETAKTRAIENKLAKIASDELELLQEKDELGRKKEENRLAKLKADKKDGRDAEARGLDQFMAISKGSEITKKISDINSDLEQLGKDREFLLNQITSAGTKTGGGSTDKLKDNLDKINKILSDSRKVAFDILKLKIEDQIKAALEITDNEKLSQKQRLEALELYYDASAKLIRAQQTFDKNELEIQTQQAIEEVRRRGKEEKLTRKQIQDEITAILENSNAKTMLIQGQYYASLLDLERGFREKRLKVIEQYSKQEVEEEKKKREALEKSIAEAFKKFEDDLKARLAREKEAGQQMLDQKKKFAEEERGLYKSVYDELTATVTAAFTAQDDRKIAGIQTEIDLLEQRKQKDIEVVNQTVANREEAAAQIAIIEARAQSQREQLQRRQREEEKKKANIERLGQIAQIVGNTAQGVVNLTIKATEARAQAALLASNPLTAAYAPVALAQSALITSQIPFVIGIGAAQLARLVIPKYKHGKNVHDDYEGPAIVGDGGKKEAIIREDGRVEITDDKPQLTHVSKRDIVLPDANMLINYVLAGHMGGRLAVNNGKNGDNSVEREIRAMKKDIVTAIQNKQELHINNSERGMAMLVHHAQGTTNYLNDNTNW
jgi:hypothetical protein